MKLKTSNAVLAAAVLAPSLSIPVAAVSAQSSLEQAWHQCLEQAIQQAGTDPQADSQRVAIFKACMTKMGHGEGK
jgi:hypothetical protein